MVQKHCLFEVTTSAALDSFCELVRSMNVDQITEDEIDTWRCHHLLEMNLYLDTPGFISAITQAATDPTDENMCNIRGDWVHVAVFKSAFEFDDRGHSVKFPELTDNYYVAITFNN